jgi:hypothetical protein
MRWKIFSLIFLASTCLAESTKTTFNPFTGKLDFITKVDSTTLPGGSTQYIQNNPSTVQTATMSITGQAGFNNALFQTYASSPTAQPDGSMWLAQDSNATLPCVFFFYGGSRYHMCGCPDSGPNNNSGQCQGFLCGVTYP